MRIGENDIVTIETNFIAQGIPVIMGEYGCLRNNKDEESVRLFLTSVCKAAYGRQICPILWDITGLRYDFTLMFPCVA